jgi:hypothetical protein
MSKTTIDLNSIAKKFLVKKKSLTDLERIVLLYHYYNEMLENINEEDESDLELQDQIIEEWVVNLFVPPEDNLDLELAALSITGSK